jgi:hypothetical protein
MTSANDTTPDDAMARTKARLKAVIDDFVRQQGPQNGDLAGDFDEAARRKHLASLPFITIDNADSRLPALSPAEQQEYEELERRLDEIMKKNPDRDRLLKDILAEKKCSVKEGYYLSPEQAIALGYLDLPGEKKRNKKTTPSGNRPGRGTP